MVDFDFFLLALLLRAALLFGTGEYLFQIKHFNEFLNVAFQNKFWERGKGEAKKERVCEEEFKNI